MDGATATFADADDAKSTFEHSDAAARLHAAAKHGVSSLRAQLRPQSGSEPLAHAAQWNASDRTHAPVQSATQCSSQFTAAVLNAVESMLLLSTPCLVVTEL